MRKMIMTLAALTAFASPAQALVILNDTFDGENGGSTALGYNGFANFSVDGGVDLIRNGSFGISCSGSCVDLDGSPGPGALVSKTIGYGLGDIFTFTFNISGNQRSAVGSDNAYLNIYDSATNALLGSFSTTRLSNAPFSNFTSTWTTTGTGAFYFKLGSSSTDNEGPLVDSALVTLTSAIPEPGTWAMMIGGFALVGASMRRRKVNVQFA